MKKKAAKKPAGWNEFDSLAKRLIEVKKTDVMKGDEAKPTKKTPKK